MSYRVALRTPYHSGAKTSTLTPGTFDVALGGHPFMLDLSNRYAQMSVDALDDLRPLAATQGELGESTLNPDSGWYRSWHTWHKGAGQPHADADGSDRARYNTSLGVDVWTKGQISLLHATTRARATSNTNLQALTVGDYLYLADGTSLVWTRDGAAFTSSTVQRGEPAQTVRNITTDGYNVYVALGPNGVHRTSRGATTTDHYNDLQASLVGYVNGRLMAAAGPSIYNITSSGAAPVALFTHPNTDFRWVTFCEGSSVLYAAGTSGDRTEIYKITITDTGTDLSAPTIAGRLPSGELVKSMGFYLGFVLVGTDSGVRFATADTTGTLALGARIPTGGTGCFEGQDRFVWCGNTNLDTGHTGLLRLDLSVFNDTAPAYANDLFAAVQGRVSSVVTYQNVRWFTVDGQGLYAETSDLVASGMLDVGETSWGIANNKILTYVDARHNEPLAGWHAVSVTDAHNHPTDLGKHVAGGVEGVFPGKAVTSETMTFTLTLGSSGSGPTITRLTAVAVPAGQGWHITLPLILDAVEQPRAGMRVPRDTEAEWRYVQTLRDTRQPVRYQRGTDSRIVIVKTARLIPIALKFGQLVQGRAVVTLQTVDLPERS